MFVIKWFIIFPRLIFRLHLHLILSPTTWLIVFLVVFGFLVYGLFRRWYVFLFFKRVKVNGTRWALITGGNGGIGLCLARLFVEDEWNVIIVGRNQEKLDSAKKELEEITKKDLVQNIKAWRYDLSDTSSPKEICDRLEEESIHIDALINNAGFAEYCYFEKSHRNEPMINTNCTSLVLLTRLLLPSMIQKGEGMVLNVSSILGFFPVPYDALYGATKSFVRSFSHALYHEMSEYNIVVSLLSPGITDTGFGKTASEKYNKKEEYQKMRNKRKMQSAEECAFEGYRGLMTGQAEVISGLNNFIRHGIVSNFFLPQYVMSRKKMKSFKNVLDKLEQI